MELQAPRWRLQEPHYLNVPGTEYDSVETNTQTKKRVKKSFPVPLLLDPKNPSDFNYPDEIIVAHAVEGAHNLRADIIFEGPPTWSMEPLNEAAEALSNKLPGIKTNHPIDSLPGQGDFSGDLLHKLSQQLDKVIMAAGGIPKGDPTIPNQAVPADAIAQLQEQMNALMAKNAELERRIAQQEHADDPLPHVEITDEVDEPAKPAKVSEPAMAEHAARAAASIGRRLA